MKPTIRDIAKIANVSHSTVSRSLNDSDLIPVGTKNRIKKIAQDVDFEFNNNARSLSTSKTGTIGVIFPEYFDDPGSNFFYSSLLKKIRWRLVEKGYDNIIDFSHNPFTKESNIKKLINKRKVDGLLVVDGGITKDDWDFIENSTTPNVLTHFTPLFADYPKVDYVSTDQFYGGYLACENLIKFGHKKILTFTNCNKEITDREFIDRTNGFIAALKDNSIAYTKNNIIETFITIDCAFEYVNQNINFISQYTAIFAQTDLMAYGIIKALKKQGFKVPEDISIIGYDDVDLAQYMEPALTTIKQPIDNLAIIACDRLVKKIKAGKNKSNELFHKVINPELVLRDSHKIIS